MGENGVGASRPRQPSLRDHLAVTTMQGLPLLTTERPTPSGIRGGGI